MVTLQLPVTEELLTTSVPLGARRSSTEGRAHSALVWFLTAAPRHMRLLRHALLLAALAVPLASCADAGAGVKKVEGNPYRARPLGAMADLGTDVYTFVVPVKIGGDRWFLVGRAKWEGDVTLLTAPDGRIPLFPRENDAWELAERVMPSNPTQRGLARMMRDTRQKMIGNRTIDLDAARKFALELDHDLVTPEGVMEAWELFGWAGELFPAPRPSRIELEVEPQRARDRKDKEALEALRASVRALHAVVIRARQFHMQQGKFGTAAWPFGGDVWAGHDDERIAHALLSAYDAFAERLSEDVGDVERSVKGQ